MLFRYEEILKLLFKHSTNTNIKDLSEKTPLIYGNGHSDNRLPIFIKHE